MIKKFLLGARGLKALRNELLNPTCSIARIQSGYTGLGPKTIILREAFVKIDFRLGQAKTLKIY